MKKLWIVLFLLMSVAGCQCSTKHGDCIGLADDPEPGLQYKASHRNIILGLIFFETLIVPADVVLFRLKCPSGPVEPAEKL